MIYWLVLAIAIQVQMPWYFFASWGVCALFHFVIWLASVVQKAKGKQDGN